LNFGVYILPLWVVRKLDRYLNVSGSADESATSAHLLMNQADMLWPTGLSSGG